MPVGMAGTVAWALVISVTEPVPSPFPYANRPVHFETEAECQNVALAINGKAHEAGVQKQLSAQCRQIEYIDVPAPSKS